MWDRLPPQEITSREAQGHFRHLNATLLPLIDLDNCHGEEERSCPPLIADEVAGGAAHSVYGYLRRALQVRMTRTGTPLTIACCDNIRQNGKMLQRNLLYTAITRGKRLVILVGDRRSLEMAVKNRESGKRWTGLRGRLSS